MSDLTPTTTKMPAVRLGITKARITQLQKKFPADQVPDANTKAGMLEIKGVLRELVPLRTGVERKRKDLVSDAVAWQKNVNAQANELKNAIAAIEAPWRDAKDEAEAEAERKKQEKARLEAERVADIESKVNYLYHLTEGLLGADLEALQARLDKANEIEVTPEEYMEYIEPATIALANAKTQLTNAIAQAQQAELQQAALDKQREEMEAEQRRMAEQQAILDKQKADQQARDAKQRKIEADKARQAELQARLPEDAKLRTYAKTLMTIAPPEITDPDLMRVRDMALDRVRNIHDYIMAATQDAGEVELVKADKAE